MVFLNILAIFIFIITLIFVYLIGYDNYSAFDDYGLVMLAFLILWMILHEILHGIGFMIFREDERGLHDLIGQTKVISTSKK